MRNQRIAAAILVIFALTVAALPQQHLTSADTNAFEMLKRALEVSAANKDKIWPAYNLTDYCFALSNPETGAYLFGFQEAPDGATQVASDRFDKPVYFTKNSRALS